MEFDPTYARRIAAVDEPMNEQREHSRRESDKALESVKTDIQKLSEFMLEYRPYLEIAMKREARRERFQNAVIEKTLTVLIVAALGMLGAALWDGAISHLKTLVGR